MGEFSSKLGLAQEAFETMDANHMQMTKYSSKEDTGYRLVLKALMEVIGRQRAILTPKALFTVSLQRTGDLVGRGNHIQSLKTKLGVPNKHCRVALVGLGGIG